MTTRVESTKDLLNETQPAVVETKNRFEYLCLNATKAYFREVVSENQTYITVIAKISLLAFPLIAAFALLEAAFDLLMAPITFIANCIAGPQEVPPEIPPADREDSKTLGVPPPAPVTPYKITESVDDIGLVKKRKPIQRSGSLDRLPLTVTFNIPTAAAPTTDPLAAPAPITPPTNPLPAAEPVPTAEPEIRLSSPAAPTTPTQNPAPPTTPPRNLTPLYFNRNLDQRQRVRDALLDIPLPPPTPPEPEEQSISNNPSSPLSTDEVQAGDKQPVLPQPTPLSQTVSNNLSSTAKQAVSNNGSSALAKRALFHPKKNIKPSPKRKGPPLQQPRSNRKEN